MKLTTLPNFMKFHSFEFLEPNWALQVAVAKIKIFFSYYQIELYGIDHCIKCFKF